MFSTTTAASGSVSTTASATTLPSPFLSAAAASATSQHLGADHHENQDGYWPFANLESLAAWALYHSNFVNRKRLPQFLFQQMHGLPQWLKLSKKNSQLNSVL